MLFLVELDHVRTGPPPTPESGRTFIEQVIFPTLTRAEHLVAERKILAGGPVAGRIALRFMIEAESAEHVDRIVTSFPIWTQAETRVTPLISFAERRSHVETLLANLSGKK
jgi:hypothetical protein